MVLFQKCFYYYFERRHFSINPKQTSKQWLQMWWNWLLSELKSVPSTTNIFFMHYIIERMLCFIPHFYTLCVNWKNWGGSSLCACELQQYMCYGLKLCETPRVSKDCWYQVSNVNGFLVPVVWICFYYNLNWTTSVFDIMEFDMALEFCSESSLSKPVSAYIQYYRYMPNYVLYV